MNQLPEAPSPKTLGISVSHAFGQRTFSLQQSVSVSPTRRTRPVPLPSCHPALLGNLHLVPTSPFIKPQWLSDLAAEGPAVGCLSPVVWPPGWQPQEEFKQGRGTTIYFRQMTLNSRVRGWGSRRGLPPKEERQGLGWGLPTHSRGLMGRKKGESETFPWFLAHATG